MRKIMSLFLIIVLLINLTSCHSYLTLTEQKDFEKFQTKKRVYVINLQTNQDSTINFSASFPGKMSNGEVTGPHQVLLDRFKPDSIIFKTSSLKLTNPKALYALKNGSRYKIINQENKLLVNAIDTTRIPFSEIKQMQIKKLDNDKTLLLVAVSTGAYAGLLLWLINESLSDMSLMGGK